jgi:hypothetical protein
LDSAAGFPEEHPFLIVTAHSSQDRLIPEKSRRRDVTHDAG